MTQAAAETDLFRPAFEAFDVSRGGDSPSWLRTLRREAIARFAALGFPTTKVEAWKYTSVAPLARTPFRLAGDGARSLPSEAFGPVTFGGAFQGRQAVFVNGLHAPELSSTTAPGGVEIRSLREAISRQPERLERHLSRIAGEEANPFTALNTAFIEDGAAVFIAPGAVVAEPIHLVFLSNAPEGPTVSHPRNLIVAGRGSQATIVESWGGVEGHVYLTNAVTEILLAEGAILDHYTVQRESEAAFHVATLGVRQERGSRFSDHSICLGGALVRNDINTLFAGEGGECALNGLFVGRGEQHMDTHTRIDHAHPRCASRELYKGVLDERSRGVFHGTILVRPDAQKTDALQVNKNLLLSEGALVQSTPALQIHADDVKCKHGSTTGRLDANALFYLRSRGIGEEAARALLIYAFASDVVGRIKIEPIRAGLEAFLQGRLPAVAEIREAVA